MQNKQNLYKIKYNKYNTDCVAGADAYKSDGTVVKLQSVAYKNVRFISGAWRVQNRFDQQVVHVRNLDVVLGQRLPVSEKNHFEYFAAKMVGENCYGKYMVDAPAGSLIVAKYDTDQGTYWAYGKTIEQARAFMGIKLYDEYCELIHRAICSERQK
ncbi:MAG: hypothetical protein KBS86_03135 [Proteobacteria bacterium]|nr:hypothetical protein [Candidatus Enterousia scatequi]